jgi:hypothetical protein
MGTVTTELKKLIKRVLRPARDALRYLSWVRKDAARNRRWSQGKGPRILVTRDCSGDPLRYEVILDWVEANFPEIRAFFELHRLPFDARDLSRYGLHVPWLQDPVQQYAPRAYIWANQLAERCDAHGIPVINRVDRLTNATKALGSRLIASAGIRTPRTEWIRDIKEFRETLLGMSLPLIVREDWGHNAPMYRATTPNEARDLPVDCLRRPIAAEFIDTRSPRDDLYRKYRYVAIGDEGVPLHQHTSTHWITRGGNCEFSEALVKEEMEYLGREDPNHELLQHARRALGLDIVAFDYSHDSRGELIVWEANPSPTLRFPRKKHRNYRRPALERTMAGIISLYLTRAGLPVPPKIVELLSLRNQAEASSTLAAHLGES